MADIFSGWAANMATGHPAEAYLGWLLRSVGAEVRDSTGNSQSALDLALRGGKASTTPAPWSVSIAAPDHRARYIVGFTGIDRPGWESCGDAAAWGWGGLAGMTGEADGPPLAPGAPLASICAALHGFLAMTAARSARLATIDVTISLSDVVASLIEIAGLKLAADGGIRGRGGDSWGLAGWGLYHCADGAVSIAIRDPEQLAVVADTLGVPELKDERYADFMWGICDAVEEAHALLTAGFLGQSVDVVVAALRPHRIAIAPAHDLAGLLADPHLTVRNAFQSDHGIRLPTFPVRRLGPATTEGAYHGTATAATRPLAGVRVLDLSSVWAGPMAARLLADLGADVIKVERPKRQVGRYSTGTAWDRDFYAILNDRNKQVYRGDLQSDSDRAALEGLIRDADILIENFLPGSLDRLGFGHAAMHRINPRLIVVSMPAMGLDGPDAQATGYGSTIEQAAGLGRLYTDAVGLPHRSGINFSDPIAGLYGAIGATLALSTGRDRSVIEVSQQEAALSLMLPTLALYQTSGKRPRADEAASVHGHWTFPGAPGDSVPVRNVAEVVGQPDSPGSRAIHWLGHPDGRDYPLVGLPWHGAFSAAVPVKAARMPEPLATEVRDHP